MIIKVHQSIDQIPAKDWNSLIHDDNIFLQHSFLDALEKNQCVSPKYGWYPQHITLYENNQLIGAMPLYLKTNNYGEFVFDHLWQDLYSRHNLAYLPKLVSSVPYTPATGSRMLSLKGKESTIFPILLNSVKSFAKDIGASSWHCLFNNQFTSDFLSKQSLLTRIDCQFHWHNKGYKTFEDFLNTLKMKKRKNIKKERKSLQNISFKTLTGITATQQDWKDFTLFYKKTFDDKFGVATLNQDFFMQVATKMPENIVLFLAYKDQKCIAGSLCYRNSTTLYGRHWGCIEEIEFLHFETCYYQGIEYCITNNLQTFEPGAQGEYKVSRGFSPVQTKSNHWLESNKFLSIIEDFTKNEQLSILQYIENMQIKTAYKN